MATGTEEISTFLGRIMHEPRTDQREYGIVGHVTSLHQPNAANLNVTPVLIGMGVVEIAPLAKCYAQTAELRFPCKLCDMEHQVTETVD